MTPQIYRHDFSAHGFFSSRSAPQERKKPIWHVRGHDGAKNNSTHLPNPTQKVVQKLVLPRQEKHVTHRQTLCALEYWYKLAGDQPERKKKNCRSMAEWQPTSNAIQVTSASASTRLHIQVHRTQARCSKANQNTRGKQKISKTKESSPYRGPCASCRTSPGRSRGRRLGASGSPAPRSACCGRPPSPRPCGWSRTGPSPRERLRFLFGKQHFDRGEEKLCIRDCLSSDAAFTAYIHRKCSNFQRYYLPFESQHGSTGCACAPREVGGGGWGGGVEARQSNPHLKKVLLVRVTFGPWYCRIGIR